MEQDLGEHDRVESQYEGEDSRLTSKKELAGWYAYGFGAEVFAICAMGVFSQAAPPKLEVLTVRSILPAHYIRTAGAGTRSIAQ